jgi:hypothetical protein
MLNKGLIRDANNARKKKPGPLRPLPQWPGNLSGGPARGRGGEEAGLPAPGAYPVRFSTKLGLRGHSGSSATNTNPVLAGDIVGHLCEHGAKNPTTSAWPVAAQRMSQQQRYDDVAAAHTSDDQTNNSK